MQMQKRRLEMRNESHDKLLVDLENCGNVLQTTMVEITRVKYILGDVVVGVKLAFL